MLPHKIWTLTCGNSGMSKGCQEVLCCSAADRRLSNNKTTSIKTTPNHGIRKLTFKSNMNKSLTSIQAKDTWAPTVRKRRIG